VTEGHKAIVQLLRLAESNHPIISTTSDASVIQVLAVALQVFKSKQELSSSLIDASIAKFIQNLVGKTAGGVPYIRSIVAQIRNHKDHDFSAKLEMVFACQAGQSHSDTLSLSPLATAPIQDVLLKRQK
jgi:hypothetical protein